MNKSIRTIATIIAVFATATIAHAVVTSDKIIADKEAAYEKELKQLKTKAAAGVAVNRDYMDLLDYKIDELFWLRTKSYQLLNCGGRDIKVEGTRRLALTYENAKKALANKIITQNEFNQTIETLKAKNQDLLEKAATVTNLTLIPQDRHSQFCSTVARTNTKFSIQPETKVDKSLKNAAEAVEIGRQIKNLIKY